VDAPASEPGWGIPDSAEAAGLAGQGREIPKGFNVFSILLPPAAAIALWLRRRPRTTRKGTRTDPEGAERAPLSRETVPEALHVHLLERSGGQVGSSYVTGRHTEERGPGHADS